MTGRQVKFGLAVDYLDGDLSLVENFEIVRRLVLEAQEAGFDLLYHPQHFLGSDSARFQPLPVLSRLAADAPGMLIAWAELLPLNHPVRVAEELATLDVITNGRAILLGVLGYQFNEFEVFGVDRSERADRLRESYELVARLLAGETVTSDGRYYPLRNERLGGMLAPVARPRPPIWMTAHNNKGVRRAALHGDAWFISHQPTLSELLIQVSEYRQLRAERPAASFHSFESHGIEMPLMREAFVAESREVAFRLAEAPMMESVREYLRSDQVSALNDPDSYRLPFEQWRIDRAFLGTPDDLNRDVERFHAELGVDCIVLKLHRRGIPFPRVLDAIRLTGRHVIAGRR